MTEVKVSLMWHRQDTKTLAVQPQCKQMYFAIHFLCLYLQFEQHVPHKSTFTCAQLEEISNPRT